MIPWLHEAPSPLGVLELAAEPGGSLVYLGFKRTGRPGGEQLLAPLAAGLTQDRRLLAPVLEQLEAYFRGALRRFELGLAPRGTPFQLRVWAELRRIPYGRTISYGELARQLGDPRACRAVGAANGANPISIVIPCHRVIGSDGSLTGYGGGLENKRALLALERGEGERQVGLFEDW